MRNTHAGPETERNYMLLLIYSRHILILWSCWTHSFGVDIWLHIQNQQVLNPTTWDHWCYVNQVDYHCGVFQHGTWNGGKLHMGIREAEGVVHIR